MRLARTLCLWSVAAIPYLLMSVSEEAGLITHVGPDGSGERLVYARSAAGRSPEARKYLEQTLPAADVSKRRVEAQGKRVLNWRDWHTADLANSGEVELTRTGILQNPWSLFTTYTWSETLAFDRGDATDIEVHGQALAELVYVVRMPGKITSSIPAGEVDGHTVTWSAKVGDDTPQTFKAESRSVRWMYLVVGLYVALFVVVKLVGGLTRLAKRVPRKPRKI